MQVVHPMQKCPVEFVETFRVILEKSPWYASYSTYICHEVGEACESNHNANDMVDWIREQLEQEYTFTSWLVKRKGFHEETDLYFVNRCRKAWLKWLVSPEGHYTPT